MQSQTTNEYFYRGFAKFKLEDYRGAIQDYNKAIELNPNHADAYNNRGLAKDKLEDYRGAIQDYNKAIELNPNHTAAYNNRGFAMNELEDYHGAIQDYNKAIELNPNHTAPYNNRGFAMNELEDYHEAKMSAIIIICLAIIILLIVSQWKIYTKADKPGWACIIPIYNTIILLEIIGKPWWWLLLFFIPFVNIVFLIWMTNLLSKSFGKSRDFTIGLIFLSFIFYPILGLGNAKYNGPAGKN